ncbi:phosphatidylglycerophosphatase A [Klebsiella pneumoniae]|nr:phosphatidylglycerophosphatase A [Klebsiella pneumoniae]
MRSRDEALSRLSMRNPWHLLATGFGSGLSPVVPGTMGSLGGDPVLVSDDLSPLAALLAGGDDEHLYRRLSVPSHGQRMGTHDHGSIVWDEFVGMWITLMALPTLDWQWVAAGFVIFRIFDMWKPWPIRWFDRNIHGRNGDYGRRHRRRRDLRWRAVRHWAITGPSVCFNRLSPATLRCRGNHALHLNPTTGCG